MRPDPFAALDPAWDSYRRKASWTSPYLDALEAYVDRFERLDAKASKSKDSPYREGSIAPFRSVPVRLMEMVRTFKDEFEDRDKQKDSEAEENRIRDLFFDETSRQVRDLPDHERGPQDDQWEPRYIWLRSLSTLLRHGQSLLRLRGGPGTGKTWITRLAATDLIEQYRSSEGRIPIWVSASMLMAEIENSKSEHILLGAGFKWDAEKMSKPSAERIAHAALKEIGAPPKATKGSKGKECERWSPGAAMRLTEMLQSGKAALIVDALDQCGNPVRIREIVEGFARTQGISLLVTGRPYVIPPADFKERVRTLETVRWNLVQIQAYAEADGLDQVTKDCLAQAWRRNSSQELVSVPQLLAFVVEGIKESPTFELNDFLSLTKFQLFQMVLGVRARRAKLSSAKLNQLATFALDHWRSQVGKNDLLYVRRSQLGRLWTPAHNAKLIGRTAKDGLGEERAEWSHRSIIEYLAGTHMASRVLANSNSDDAIAGLASFGFDPGLHELLRFAYGYLTEKCELTAERLLALLVDQELDDSGATRLSAAVTASHDAPLDSPSRSLASAGGRWLRGQASYWKLGAISPPKGSSNSTPVNKQYSESQIAGMLITRLADGIKPDEVNWKTIGDISGALGKMGAYSSANILIKTQSKALLAGPVGWQAYLNTIRSSYALGDQNWKPMLNEALGAALEAKAVDWLWVYEAFSTIRGVGQYCDPLMVNRVLDSALYSSPVQWGVVARTASTLGQMDIPSSETSLGSALKAALEDEPVSWELIQAIAQAMDNLGDRSWAPTLNGQLVAVLEERPVNWRLVGKISNSLSGLGDVSSLSVVNRALLAALNDSSSSSDSSRCTTVQDFYDTKPLWVIATSAARLGDHSSASVLNSMFSALFTTKPVDLVAVKLFAKALDRLNDLSSVALLNRELLDALSKNPAGWDDIQAIAYALGLLGDRSSIDTLRYALTSAIRYRKVFSVVEELATALTRLGDHVIDIRFE